MSKPEASADDTLNVAQAMEFVFCYFKKKKMNRSLFQEEE